MIAEPRPLLRWGAHLLVLSSLAIAQPLLDLLGRYPAFFAAHDVTRWGIVLFALVVLLGPALVLTAITGVALAFNRRAGVIVQIACVGLLGALFALTIVRRFGWAPLPTFLIAAALGAVVAWLYADTAAVRSTLTVLVFAPVLFGVLFLFTSSTSALVKGGDARIWNAKARVRPPIVLVTFDAFPVQMLEAAKDRIDARRFPNFAELRRSGTWYPNATNVHENTVFSVPSILDGRIPGPGESPTLQGHPNNIFTLLGRTYRMRISEEVTNMCPAGLCTRPNEGSSGDRLNVLASDVGVVYEYLVAPDGLRDDLPPIQDRWRDFRSEEGSASGPRTGNKVLDALAGGQRPQRFRGSVAAIRPDARPTLDFMHVLLPHEPLEYLPNGQRYQAGAQHDSSLDGPPSYDNPFLTDQAFQRHLLQLGFVDGLVGELIARLKQQGMWDKAMVIMTADHGVSFRVDPQKAPPFVPGKLGYRRDLTEENVQDVATIPLFVKYPGQRKGRVDRRWGRTIDVLPTIADVLGIRLPFKVDGTSLRTPRPVPASLTFVKTDGTMVTVPVPTLERRKAESLRRQIGLLGTSWADAYRIGPNPQLIGRRVASSAAPAGGVRARVENAGKLADVDLRSPNSPLHIAGRLTGGAAAGRDLAFALNGTIVSVGRSFPDLGPNRLNFSSLVPAGAFRAGRNDLEVYEVAPGGRLVPLGS